MQYSGLNSEQVEAARAKGVNRLGTDRKKSAAGLFFNQFKDVMILILAVATVISALMGETAEAITIIAIVLLNACMGFIQEHKTEKTLSALQAMTAPTASVMRDGRKQSIPAAEIVCGDIALLEAGDRIPADGELLEAVHMASDESLLTGESAAVDKKNGDAVYMGTTVASGKGVMKVNAVGMRTEMGRIAAMVENTEEEKTPLQKRLQQLGKTVAAGCLFVCFGVSLIGWFRGESLLETLLSGISLAVAAIPEGMPAIVTIVLALSVGRILKKGAIIRRLPAVETLGCAGVICSDKTGTITQNRMTLDSVYLEERFMDAGKNGETVNLTAGSSKQTFLRLMRCVCLCSNAQMKTEKECTEVQGSATEAALLAGAAKLGVSPEKLRQKYTRVAEDPFDSNKKRMSVIVKAADGKRVFLCKGAPDILLRMCIKKAENGTVTELSAADRRRILAAVDKMAEQGCRVLAFAENENAAAGEKGMTFLGLTGLKDPPKPQVESAVSRCRRAGIKPVMITGDYPQTAKAIAEQVGIWRGGDELITGEELDKLTDEALARRCMKASVYARVTPQHKLRIVRAYQNCGQVAAMTGDAVVPENNTEKDGDLKRIDRLCLFYGNIRNRCGFCKKLQRWTSRFCICEA